METYIQSCLKAYREPEFVPPTNQTAAEGQTVNMTCSINGILNPMISWRKYGNEIEFDDRIYLFDDGTLHIRVSTYAINMKKKIRYV